jgi:hypothetical protein
MIRRGHAERQDPLALLGLPGELSAREGLPARSLALVGAGAGRTARVERGAGGGVEAAADLDAPVEGQVDAAHLGCQPRYRWPGSRVGRVVLRVGSVFNYASDASA